MRKMDKPTLDDESVTSDVEKQEDAPNQVPNPRIKDTAVENPDETDSELEQLLDESLTDLSTYTKNRKVETVQPAGAKSKPTQHTNPSVSHNGVPSGEDFMNALFGGLNGADLPGGDDAAFEEELQNFFKDDPGLKAEFEKLTQQIPTTDSSGTAHTDFADTLAQTLTSLSQNAESLQNAEFSDEDLMKSFQESLKLGADGGGDSESEFIPMMHNIMSNLLSKEILYPSLKDLAEKYPGWLSSNNGKVDKEKFDSYVQQFDLVCKLCDEYDSEKSTDSEQVKAERFEKILDLMNQMQDCGPPPPDIVSQLAPGLNFNSEGQPQIPGMDKCSIM